MAQLLRTVCDKHKTIEDVDVDTDIPTIRIIVDGGVRDMRRDIEGEWCSGCVIELLTAIEPFVESGRRPNTAQKRLPPSPPKNANSNGGSGESKDGPKYGPRGYPAPNPTNPDGSPVLDEFERPITNAGPYPCGAPGQKKCIRHRIGFATTQGRSGHERGSHGFNRNQNPDLITTPDPTPEQLARLRPNG